jgi:hypothetical protein
MPFTLRLCVFASSIACLRFCLTCGFFLHVCRNGNGSDAYAGVESGDEDELSGIEIDVGSEDEEEGGGGGGGRKGKGSHAGQGNGRRALGTVPTSRFVRLIANQIWKSVVAAQTRQAKKFLGILRHLLFFGS